MRGFGFSIPRVAVTLSKGVGLPILRHINGVLAILLVETARVRREGAWPAAAGFQALRPLCLSERAEILGGAEAVDA